MEFEVLKRNNLKRNIILGVVLVAIISAVVLNFTRAKYRTAQSMPLINGTVNYDLADLNAVAVYIQDESSTDGYTRADTIPTKGYTFNEEASYCTVNGEEDTSITLSYEMDTQMLIVTPMTTKGTKCYLYFDEYNIPASNIIENSYEENSDIMAYDEAGNLRYIGADPNNYVYFNCDDYSNSSNNTCELWRIIGIFSDDTHDINGKLIKLVRNASIGSIAWDSNSGYSWEEASLQVTLNGDYLNRVGSYTNKGIKNNTTRDMIETVNWKLGYNSSNLTALDHYTRERNTASAILPSLNRKIGLIYISDYIYSTSGGNSTDRNTCLETGSNNWARFSDCGDNSWINETTSEWTLSVASNGVLMRATGFADYNGGTFYNHHVRPSVYLKPNISITGGTGTNSDPYTLSL